MVSTNFCVLFFSEIGVDKTKEIMVLLWHIPWGVTFFRVFLRFPRLP